MEEKIVVFSYFLTKGVGYLCTGKKHRVKNVKNLC